MFQLFIVKSKVLGGFDLFIFSSMENSVQDGVSWAEIAW